jgi:glycine/D-amino acid oxidase-like deaminating enzyme
VTPSADVIVLGAGIVGAACAESLAIAGLDVLVCERSIPAGRATAAGMGHVLVLDDSEAQLAITRAGRDLWRAREFPAAVDVDHCGTLWVATDEEEMAAARSRRTWFADRGIASETIDATTLRELEPELAHDLVGALLVPDDLVVYPPTATTALLESARGHGARIRRDTRAIEVARGMVQLQDGTRLHAGHVVVALGLAARELAYAPGIAPPALIAKKGHLVISDRAPGFVRHQLVELGYLKSAHGSATRSVAFNAQPRVSGQVLLGSSRQVNVDDDLVEFDLLAEMLDRGFRFLPRLRELPALRTWVGHRPTTPDNLPLIGPLVGDPQTILAVGHEGVGITTSLSTARLVTELLLARTPSFDPTAFAPDRDFAATAHG